MSAVPRAALVRRWRVLPLVLLVCAPAQAQLVDDAALLRIFLKDGRSLTSYGEFAHVGNRVVFSLPLGEAAGHRRLHLASVPADQVDWPATDRYREAARAAHYAAARGEEDFARMSGDVARILNDIALTTDAAAQLALAERARQRLVEWPREHYGYRAEEVRQILSILDEVVSELRAARGEQRFDLSLVAAPALPPATPLLPPPSLQESILQALIASRFAETAGDRVSLARAAVALLDVGRGSLPASWAGAARADAMRTLAQETDLTRQYAVLTSRALARAERAASRGDVRALDRVLQDVRARDRALGSRRPDEVQALLSTLTERLDATRRLRLARDQWALKERALQAYGTAVARPLVDLNRARPVLDDIRTLAGPDAGRLRPLFELISRSLARLHRLQPPADARPVHGILLSAFQLAENAGRLRLSAIASGDVRMAWDASAAAAGALMLAERARGELQRTLAPPRMP